MLLIFQKVLNQVWTYWLSPIWNNWAVCGYDSAAIKSLSNIHSPRRMLCAWLKGKHMGRARNKMGILKLGMCLQGLLPPDGVEADPGCCRQGVCTQLLFPHTCKSQELPWIKAISGDSNKAFPAVHSWTAEGHGNYRHTAQNMSWKILVEDIRLVLVNCQCRIAWKVRSSPIFSMLCHYLFPLPQVLQ